MVDKTVEELTSILIDSIGNRGSSLIEIANLIAAARVEGAELKRLEIRKVAQITEYDAAGYAILFAVPAFLLAPKVKP